MSEMVWPDLRSSEPYPSAVTLRVALFWARDTRGDAAAAPLFARATEIFRRYNLLLDAAPGPKRAAAAELPLQGEVAPSDPEAARVLGLCAARAPWASSGRLPVVFCRLGQSFAGYTSTAGDWPVALINLVEPWPAHLDRATLAHEIGHAAGVGHVLELRDADAPLPPGYQGLLRNLMWQKNQGLNRDWLNAAQVYALANAPFAVLGRGR